MMIRSEDGAWFLARVLMVFFLWRNKEGKSLNILPFKAHQLLELNYFHSTSTFCISQLATTHSRNYVITSCQHRQGTAREDALFHLYKCRNAVSMWDTSGSWLMWAWHMAKYEGGIIIFHRNRKPSTVLLTGIVVSTIQIRITMWRVLKWEMRQDKSGRVMLMFFPNPIGFVPQCTWVTHFIEHLR